MKPRSHYELPEDKEKQLRKAVRLEWTTIFFLITITIVMYLVMGSSQAMKAAWIEDVLSLVPPIAFLIGIRFRDKKPNRQFPYGYRRATIIAALVASTALFAMGLYILIDSVMKLVSQEHPTLGLKVILGQDVWEGWLMIAALVYSMIPPVILGRMKLPLAHELHERTLHADAEMNKADWMTAGAAILGIIGIGFGLWWADAVAAGIIGLDVTYDGFKNLKGTVYDLLDQRPTKVDKQEPEGIDERLAARLRQLDWVQAAAVRLRSEGHVFCGEAFIVPAPGTTDLPDKIADATRLSTEFDWRLHDVVITAVPRLD